MKKLTISLRKQRPKDNNERNGAMVDGEFKGDSLCTKKQKRKKLRGNLGARL